MGVPYVMLADGRDTLAEVFRGGRDGFAYRFDTPEGLFQDDAGTTPVTAGGQPIGFARDWSGNGHHATQATAGARPTWTDAGPGSYASWDGSDWLGTGYVEGPAMTIGVAWRATNALDGAMGAYATSPLRACNLLLAGGANLGHAAGSWGADGSGTNNSVSGPDLRGVSHVLVQRGDAIRVGLYVNGNSVYGPTAASGLPYQTTQIIVGGYSFDGSPQGAVGGRIWRAIAIEDYVPDRELYAMSIWLGLPSTV